MDIIRTRISATPRSKYRKYVGYGGVGGNTTVVQQGSGGDYVFRSGEDEQTVEGSLATTGDLAGVNVTAEEAVSGKDVKASNDVTAENDVTAKGDVIAYTTGTNVAPFRFWRPSVDALGNLSWTNSTSEAVPPTVNIKGPQGDPGEDGGGASMPTVQAAAGPDIGTVGTPSVTVSQSGTVYTFTFHKLKGEKGEKGDKGDPGDNASSGATSPPFDGGTIHQDLTIKKRCSVLTLEGDTTELDFQAAQIVFVNEAFTDYRHKWCIDLSDEVEQDGDLVFQNYDSSDRGSAHEAPFYRFKIYKHGTATNAVAAAGAYVNASDARLKNVLCTYHGKPAVMDSASSVSVLDKIKGLESKYYLWKAPEDGEEAALPFYNTVQLGFVAQDVEKEFPEFVSEDNGYKLLDYAGLGSFIAVEGCRELDGKIARQQEEIDLLRQELQRLKGDEAAGD